MGNNTGRAELPARVAAGEKLDRRLAEVGFGRIAALTVSFCYTIPGKRVVSRRKTSFP
jgi:hypothetical protein